MADEYRERPYGWRDPIVLHAEGPGGLPVRGLTYPEGLPGTARLRCEACAKLSPREPLRVLEDAPKKSQQPKS